MQLWELEGAVNIIHRREIAAAEEENKEETRQKLVEEYKTKFGDPYVAAKNGWLDDVIEPRRKQIKINPCTQNSVLKTRMVASKETRKYSARIHLLDWIKTQSIVLQLAPIQLKDPIRDAIGLCNFLCCDFLLDYNILSYIV